MQAMSDPNGWPDPQRPGVPLNPERDGAHMLRRKGADRLRQFFWSAGTDWDAMTPVRAAYDFCYEGPCLAPAEVAARVAEARRDALREAAAYLQSCAKALRLRDAEDRGIPDQPCHADVLLELANAPPEGSDG
jgi:hypothetical protein